MKGQVSIFIIVGIFLVIIIGLVLFVFQEQEIQRNEVFIDKVPSQYSPLQEFVHSCMQDVGKDAIQLLGERGGYVFSENYPFADQLGLQAFADQPTEGNAIQFAPDILIPYWYYLSSPNHASTFVISSKKPVLHSPKDQGVLRDHSDNSIEAQMDRYVNARLQVCLNNFQVFDEIIIETAGVPITTTFVTEEDVIVNVYYPLNATVGSNTEKIENFGVHIPVRLKDIYELAELITQAQADYTFLEQNLLNLITYYADVDGDLPPMADFEFAFGSSGKRWTKDQIKNSLETILASNTQLHQVEGARNYPAVFGITLDEAADTRQNVYADMVLPIVDAFDLIAENVDIDSLDELSLASTEATFHYLSFPIYLGGGTVEPKVIGVNFPPFVFGAQQYETLYKVSWPVMVTLKDVDAFSGEGLTFRFGLEGNIRNNIPVTTDFVQTTNRFDLGVSLCSNEQRTEKVTITVSSDYCTPACPPIEGAGVLLDLTQESCSLGITNESGEVIVSLPSGTINGMLRVSHPDYVFSFIPVAVNADGYDMFLPPLQVVNFSVKKVIMQEQGGVWVPTGEEDLDALEEVVVSFTRTKDEEQFFHDAFSIGATIPGSPQNMAAGSYEVQAFLLGAPDALLGAESLRSFDTLDVPDSDEAQQQHLVSITANPARQILGGVEFDNENPLIILKEHLHSGKDITLYVFDFGTDVPPVDLIANLTRLYSNEVAPLIE